MNRRYYVFYVDPYQEDAMPQVWTMAVQEQITEGVDKWKTLSESTYGFETRDEAVEYALGLPDGYPVASDSLPFELGA